MELLKAIEFFDIPENMYFLMEFTGLFSDFIIINKGEYLYFHKNNIIFQNGSNIVKFKSTQKEIKKQLFRSDRYKQYLRKELRIKKLEQINDK